MALIDIIKSLSTVLSRAITKSLQHRIFWESVESNPGPLGVKQVCYPLCYSAPSLTFTLPKSVQAKSIIFFGAKVKIYYLVGPV